jgi:hypothetical protein
MDSGTLSTNRIFDIRKPDSTKNMLTPIVPNFRPGTGKKCPMRRKTMASPRQPSK